MYSQNKTSEFFGTTVKTQRRLHLSNFLIPFFFPNNKLKSLQTRGTKNAWWRHFQKNVKTSWRHSKIFTSQIFRLVCLTKPHIPLYCKLVFLHYFTSNGEISTEYFLTATSRMASTHNNATRDQSCGTNLTS